MASQKAKIHQKSPISECVQKCKAFPTFDGVRNHRFQTKAQYSMEFLIFFALISILFLVWLMVYLDLNQEVFMERDKKAILDLGKSIQTQLFVASNAHSGYYSRNLIIPEKAGQQNFEINNTPYVFYIRVDDQDYVFNIPYTLGKLQKDDMNTLWNLEGVVGVGECPPTKRPDGNINFTECSDGIDNDGDDLIDKLDPGCWRWITVSYTYDCYFDNEGRADAGAKNFLAESQCRKKEENGKCTTTPPLIVPGLGLNNECDCCSLHGKCCAPLTGCSP